MIENITDLVRRGYDTIMYLTLLIVASKLLITWTTNREKKVIENDIRKEELRKLRLDNDEKESRQLPHDEHSKSPPTS